MKKFINKISKGSFFALFLEILLLFQVVVIINALISMSNYECHHDNYIDNFVVAGDE